MSKSQPTSIRLKTEIRTYLKKEAAARRWGLMRLIEVVLEQWVEWDRKNKKKCDWPSSPRP